MQRLNAVTRAAEFHKKGYVRVTGILSGDDIECMVQNLDRMSGEQRGAGGWTVPDGVTQTRCFWPLIFNWKLLSIVRELIGPDIRFLQHNDLHVGFSSLNWHRDSASRKLGEGGDWDETEPYRIVRVGFYLQPRNVSSFQLGLLPGTHHTPSSSEAHGRKRLEAMAGSVSLLRRVVFGRNSSPAIAVLVKGAASDGVGLDPPGLHTRSRT